MNNSNEISKEDDKRRAIIHLFGFPNNFLCSEMVDAVLTLVNPNQVDEKTERDWLRVEIKEKLFEQSGFYCDPIAFLHDEHRVNYLLDSIAACLLPSDTLEVDKNPSQPLIPIKLLGSDKMQPAIRSIVDGCFSHLIATGGIAHAAAK